MERLNKKIAEQKQSDIALARNKLRLERIRTQKRVRTYNYITNTVTDHRTGQRYNLTKFMEGKIQ
jgi:protein subunit release factor A